MSVAGKLIKKKDERAQKRLSIEEYPWLQFKEQDIVQTDNERNSVIYQKIHTKEELKNKVQNPPQFNFNLGKKLKTIFPSDMTSDYESALKEALKRKRRRMLGEEEAMALELAELDLSADQRLQMSSWRDKNQKKSPSELEKEKKSKENPGIKIPEKEHNDKVTSEEIIKKTETTFIESKVTEIPVTQPFGDKVTAENKIPTEIKGEIDSENKIMTERNNENLIKNEKEIEDQKKKGFEEGYASGVEKAQKETAHQLEEERTQLKSTLENLVQSKEKMLTEGKNIFLEIIKLCSEKILKKELTIHDDALINLFHQITENYKNENQLIVEINPDDLERLEDLLEESLKKKIEFKKNETFQTGQIVVKSQKSLSQISLSTLIDSLVDKIKNDIFEEHKEYPKAG